MEIIAIIGIIILLWYLFSPSKKPPVDHTAKTHKALDRNPNKNQDNLINTVFAIAEKSGGLWKISFNTTTVSIYKKDGSSEFINYRQLGYDELDLHQYITYANSVYYEFPCRLKRVAESRGYLFWLERGYGFYQGSTYTSYDGGHSFSRDSEGGNYNKSVNVCSKEYYRIHKPYPDPNAPPLKKL